MNDLFEISFLPKNTNSHILDLLEEYSVLISKHLGIKSEKHESSHYIGDTYYLWVSEDNDKEIKLYLSDDIGMHGCFCIEISSFESECLVLYKNLREFVSSFAKEIK